MKKKRKIKFDIRKILSKKCRWMFIIGMRSNGKSFEVKFDAIERAYKENKKIIYVRRWDTDIKTKSVISYFTRKFIYYQMENIVLLDLHKTKI